MQNARWLLPAVLLFAACASAPAEDGRPRLSSELSIDAVEYRKQLEEAYDHVVVLQQTPGTVPLADVEAVASIEIPDHRSIRGALTYFTTDLRESIQTSLLRSARYKKMIDEALAERKLPKGLAYLPVIESAYVPTLTSRAGAHGVWQFMPETAREYGLRVDWWIDERADPRLSTRAAAAYLEDLYRMFDDWPLALAAYNAGPGRIQRALDSTGARNFWELLDMVAIPKETRGYVPTFYATLQIAGDPEAYGFVLGTPEQSDEAEIAVDGPLSLKYLAEVVEAEESALREMNPALRRGIVPPGGANVRVPAAAAPLVAERAATLKNEDDALSVCTFTIRKGDTVRELARAIGAKPETVLAMNGLKPSSKVRPGQALFLPVRARELGNLLRHWDDRKYFYAVRKGDTLYSIAKKHNLSAAELRELNDLGRKTKLQPGQKLRVTMPPTVTAGGM
jgi:membrane-bound lytic murein transglycosylase D